MVLHCIRYIEGPVFGLDARQMQCSNREDCMEYIIIRKAYLGYDYPQGVADYRIGGYGKASRDRKMVQDFKVNEIESS